MMDAKNPHITKAYPHHHERLGLKGHEYILQVYYPAGEQAYLTKDAIVLVFSTKEAARPFKVFTVANCSDGTSFQRVNHCSSMLYAEDYIRKELAKRTPRKITHGETA